MAGTRLLAGRGLAPAAPGRAHARGLAARVVAKAEGGGKANKSKGKKDEGGEWGLCGPPRRAGARGGDAGGRGARRRQRVACGGAQRAAAERRRAPRARPRACMRPPRPPPGRRRHGFIAAASLQRLHSAHRGPALTPLPLFTPTCKGPYSATVKVPVTDFSMRANAVVREPEIQSYWAQQRVYESLVTENPGVSRAVC
jgi:hypothetical protein